MAINALQVAWISRLAEKKFIRQGDGILEFGPQDLICPRAAVEQYGLRHRDPATVKKVLDEAYEGERPKPVVPSAFYSLFGVRRYRSVDLSDRRSDWLRDCNKPFRLPERFDVVTNFGTAEHVFNIAALFRSVHDALKPGGVALHILPAFGDIDHGFYNIHPTTYLDLAAANEYVVEDLCYVDRWDIRNRILEENLAADFDFASLPIQMTHLHDRSRLQRMIVDLYNANYNDPKTKQYGPEFPGYIYDYCLVALRKTKDRSFRFPMQAYYGGGIAPSSLPWRARAFLAWRRLTAALRGTLMKPAARRYIEPVLPNFVWQSLVRLLLKTILRDLALDVSGVDPGLSPWERWVPFIINRQTYPAPPLNMTAMTQMMAVLESRIEKLYDAAQLKVSINDLDPSFLKRVRGLLISDAAFVSFVADRYQKSVATSPARRKVADDILCLVALQ